MTILDEPLPEGKPQNRIFYDPDTVTSLDETADPCGLVVSLEGKISHLVIPPGSKQAKKFADLIEHNPNVAKNIVPITMEKKTYYLIPKIDSPSLPNFLKDWFEIDKMPDVLPEDEVLDRINEIRAGAPQRLANVLLELGDNIEHGEIERPNAKQHFLSAMRLAQLDKFGALSQEVIPPIFRQLPPEVLPALAKYHKDLTRRNDPNAAKGGPTHA